MGGPQVNGLQLLAAGQLDVAMADALQVLSAVEQNVPVIAIAATFQKNPTVIIAHPGVNARGPQGQADRGRRRQQHDVLAVAAPEVRLHRRPEASVRVFRAAVSRRPEAVAAGLRDVRAVLDREGRREAGRVPARRLRLSALFRSARRDARRRSRGRSDALERFVRASAEGWKSYLANPAPGNALIKQAQSRR